jgi:hypothetical protein
MRKPLSIDGDMARRFLDLLDPDHDQFLFAAGDDNQERAKVSLKPGKPPWIDHLAANSRIPPGGAAATTLLD